jgi:hypothetical protein
MMKNNFKVIFGTFLVLGLLSTALAGINERGSGTGIGFSGGSLITSGPGSFDSRISEGYGTAINCGSAANFVSGSRKRADSVAVSHGEVGNGTACRLSGNRNGIAGNQREKGNGSGAKSRLVK